VSRVLHCSDGLTRQVDRDGHVQQELAARRIGDERALVTDDGLRPREVAAHRLEHATRDDDHVRAARAHLSQRRARARP
jgi:hypothetical protein